MAKLLSHYLLFVGTGASNKVLPMTCSRRILATLSGPLDATTPYHSPSVFSTFKDLARLVLRKSPCLNPHAVKLR